MRDRPSRVTTVPGRYNENWHVPDPVKDSITPSWVHPTVPFNPNLPAASSMSLPEPRPHTHQLSQTWPDGRCPYEAEAGTNEWRPPQGPEGFEKDDYVFKDGEEQMIDEMIACLEVSQNHELDVSGSIQQSAQTGIDQQYYQQQEQAQYPSGNFNLADYEFDVFGSIQQPAQMGIGQNNYQQQEHAQYLSGNFNLTGYDFQKYQMETGQHEQNDLTDLFNLKTTPLTNHQMGVSEQYRPGNFNMDALGFQSYPAGAAQPQQQHQSNVFTMQGYGFQSQQFGTVQDVQNQFPVEHSKNSHRLVSQGSFNMGVSDLKSQVQPTAGSQNQYATGAQLNWLAEQILEEQGANSSHSELRSQVETDNDGQPEKTTLNLPNQETEKDDWFETEATADFLEGMLGTLGNTTTHGATREVLEQMLGISENDVDDEDDSNIELMAASQVKEAAIHQSELVLGGKAQYVTGAETELSEAYKLGVEDDNAEVDADEASIMPDKIGENGSKYATGADLDFLTAILGDDEDDFDDEADVEPEHIFVEKSDSTTNNQHNQELENESPYAHGYMFEYLKGVAIDEVEANADEIHASKPECTLVHQSGDETNHLSDLGDFQAAVSDLHSLSIS